MSKRNVRFNSGKLSRRSKTAGRAVPSVADSFSATVRDVSSDGKGIIEAPDGQVLFVAGVWPGEVLQLTRKRTGRDVTVRVDEILEASPSRILPRCASHSAGVCGGCPWMFVDYDAQVEQKHRRLERSLLRLGHVEAKRDFAIAPRPFEYRNRAQFKSDGKALGYVARETHDIADIAECPILTPINNRKLRALRTALPNSAWTPSKKRQWTTIDIDDERERVMIDQRQPFRQGNSDQNTFIINWLKDCIFELDEVDSIVELFCGSGNFTKVLAETSASHIVAVEGDDASIAQLTAQGLRGVTGIRANLFSESDIRTLVPNVNGRLGVVLDPPREGLKERAALTTLFSNARWVVYIACDLATWERDCGFLSECGLSPQEARGLDMFPQTPHMEILSVFTRA
ncbi:MAG: class I SAM-dependent RNA methyltransferase [Halieaceae bacterium]|nr:class I SAM-dependent RNA methyltransferase [Halieaceae bacterium]